MRRIVPSLLLAAACAAARPPVDLGLDDGQGGRFLLSSLRGRPVLVVFLATWCMPCLAMLPALAGLRQGEGELAIVAVGMDLEGRAVLEPFQEHYRLPFPVLPADAAVREGRTDFGPIKELPALALLDAEGRVAAAWTGPVTAGEIDRALAELH